MRGPLLAGAARVLYTPNVNIVFDGNSLVAGGALGSDAPTLAVPGQVKSSALLNNQVPVVNIGINGQTIADMRTRGTVYADGNYVPKKKNILIAWEGTNSICNTTMTGQAAGTAMAAYCADRLAAHPDWLIVLMTTLPRFDVSAGNWSIAQANAELSNFDTYLKANFKAMGAKALVDVRAGGIFTYTGTSMNAAMAPYMKENIHYNATGGTLLAKYVTDVLKTLKPR